MVPKPVTARLRAQWTERVESYAREAAPNNRPFAEALVELAAPEPGARVLDVATGPGIVAVEAAKRIGPGGSVLATDFIPDWEPYVLANAAAAGVTNVTFAEMAAEALTLADESFDVVLCQFGVMFMPEPERALREMRRVLRPGGRLGIVVWSVLEKVGLFLVPGIIDAALPPPEEAPPSPTSMGEPGLIEALVTAADFRDLATHRVIRFSQVADPETEWQAWAADTGSPIGRGLATLPERAQQQLHDEAIAALETYRDGDTVRIPSEAIVVVAVR